jgi:DNA-binding winged helix-turn-helix (wHTH) protein/pimeloyl-ACP methyl ester carboxylesterase
MRTPLLPSHPESILTFTFGPFVLDPAGRELRNGSTHVDLEPQVFDLLVHLITHQDRVVSADELFDTIWKGRIVSLSTLTSRINAARAALGDSGADQKFIKTVPRKGYRFVGQAVLAGPPRPAPQVAPLHPDVRFCRASDGGRIAYATVGEGEPLVKAGNWLNHLDYDWESPIWGYMLRWFATGNQLIRYDARGSGLSDRDTNEISIAAFANDLATVADAANLGRFSLFGSLHGAAVAITYAVKHPERVRKLVIYGGFIRGRLADGNPVEAEQAEAMKTLVRTGWDLDSPAFRQIFTALMLPQGSAEQTQWFNDMQRLTASPQNAVRFREAFDNLDISGLLAQVRVPTLVLHCRGDTAAPFEDGRAIAAGIPGARFVALEGNNHLMLDTDPGWPRFQAEVEAFLAS